MGARWSKYFTNNETEAANRLPSLSQMVTIARKTDSKVLQSTPENASLGLDSDIETQSQLTEAV